MTRLWSLQNTEHKPAKELCPLCSRNPEIFETGLGAHQHSEILAGCSVGETRLVQAPLISTQAFKINFLLGESVRYFEHQNRKKAVILQLRPWCNACCISKSLIPRTGFFV